MTETEFHRAADTVIDRIETLLGDRDDLDLELEGGVLSIVREGGERVIVNRQAPNREIWIAARSGGFHYACRDGEWRDTRTGAELFEALKTLLGGPKG
jgi:CyaY protein